MRCPECGSEEVECLGTVFIEDGPWNGRNYVNEGDYPRYRCKPCGTVFGLMPVPLVCSKCGEENVYGEIGEDCDVDPNDDSKFICEDCMKLGDGGPPYDAATATGMYDREG